MKTKPGVADVVVANLKRLMKAKNITREKLSIASGVSKRMIAYVLNNERTPTVEVADALAKAFGMEGWQLQVPNINIENVDPSNLSSLVKNYSATPESERKYIDRVAEKEAKYKP